MKKIIVYLFLFFVLCKCGYAKDLIDSNNNVILNLHYDSGSTIDSISSNTLGINGTPLFRSENNIYGGYYFRGQISGVVDCHIVNWSNFNDLIGSGNSFSLSWIMYNNETRGNNHILLSFAPIGEDSGGFQLKDDLNNATSYRIDIGYTNGNNYYYFSMPKENDFHTYIITYNKSNTLWNFYSDGILYYSVYQNYTLNKDTSYKSWISLGGGVQTGLPLYEKQKCQKDSRVYIDEITLWNITLDSEQVTQLNNFLSNNITYNYSVDLDSPLITIISPLNNSIVNNNVYINFTLNENANCSLNNTAFTNIYNNSIDYSFYENTLTDGNYNILIECIDSSNNIGYNLLNFNKQLANINIEYPLNNSNINDIPFSCIFNFNYFNPFFCGLYINDILRKNITLGNYNQTIYNFYNDTNVLGYYRMENNLGNIAYDSSSYKYNGIIRYIKKVSSKGGNATLNYAFGFGGKQRINISDKDIYSFGDSSNDKPFSITSWIRLNNSGGGDMILSKRGANKEYGLQISGSGYSRITFQLWDNSLGGKIGRSYSTPMGNNEWLFITATYNGNKSENGIKIYLNKNRVDDTSTSTGSYISMENTNSKLIIGSTSDGIAYFNGKIDEVSLWNKTLNQNEINYIYNYGVKILLNSSYIETVNQSLNQSINYSLNYTFPSNTKENISYFINCYNGVNINSSIFYGLYDNDFTSPEINILSPLPNNDTKNNNIYINFTTNEYSICNLNNSNFTNIFNNGTYFIFYESTLENNFYSINVSCIDLSINNNSVYSIIYFNKDIEYPFINFISPKEDNSSFFNNKIHLRFNSTDNRDLYNVFLNFTHIDTNLIFYELFLNLSGTQQYYEYNNLINFTGWELGEYLLKSRVCDSHTKNKIKKADKIEKTNSKIKYKFKNKNIIIESITGCEENTFTNYKNDKYDFQFEYYCNKNIKEFILTSNENIDYLYYSDYKGHFIIGNHYIDFENEGNVKIENIGNNSYLIKVYNSNKKIKFNSIGELNCNEKELTFILNKESTDTGNLVNTFEFTNIILFYSLFILIQLFFLYLAFRFEIKWVAILSSLMAMLISFSFLRFVTLNRLFQNAIIVYIFINLIIIFVVSLKGE